MLQIRDGRDDILRGDDELYQHAYVLSSSKDNKIIVLAGAIIWFLATRSVYMANRPTRHGSGQARPNSKRAGTVSRASHAVLEEPTCLDVGLGTTLWASFRVELARWARYKKQVVPA